MSASIEFRKAFIKRYLKEIYNSYVRYKSAVGVDRVNTKTFEGKLSDNIDVIYKKVPKGTYRFSQYREKLLSRGSEKTPRVISIPTIRDKLTLKALYEVIYSVYGTRIPSLLKLISEVISTIKDNNYSSFIRLDVKDFYPSIRHDLLLNEVKRRIRKKEILYLIENAISQKTVSQPEGQHKTFIERGVPQGLSISNILANIYLTPIDNNYSYNLLYKYFRYADDILILCNADDISQIRDEIHEDFDKLGLKLHDENDDPLKSSSGKISDSFKYLGYEFKSSGITVSKKSIDKICESIIKIFTKYKYSDNMKLKQLKWHLDLRITGFIFDNTRRGWLLYYSQMEDIEQLKRLDHFVNIMCNRFKVHTTRIKFKTFVCSYNEIKHKMNKTKYIPKLDKMDIDEKRRLLNEIFKIDTQDMDEKQIDYQFKKRIFRIVKDFEKDLARPS